MSNTLTAQDLNQYQWEHRLILVITKDTASKVFQKQIQELTQNMEGLIERKLLLYKVTPTQYQLIDPRKQNQQNHWINTDALYATYGKNDPSFKVLLFGLDGGIKLEKVKILTTNELFRIIDSMPMRAAEMRRKN